MKYIHSLIILLFMSLSFAYRSQYFSDEEAAKEFDIFLNTFPSKTYASPEEFEYRFSVFKKNLDIAFELNDIDTAEFGVTIFSDLTDEEFENYLSMKDIELIDTDYTPLTSSIENDEIPDFIDWAQKGKTPPVRNQGSKCGSCWSISACDAISSAYAIKNNNEPLVLSPSFLIDCVPKYGCSGGFPHVAFEYLISNNLGLPLEKNYPYVPADQSCPSFETLTFFDQLKSYELLPVTKDYVNLYKQNVAKGPIAIGIASKSLKYYKRGIISNPRACLGNLNHAVLIVGMSFQQSNGEIAYWKIQNSWGEDYGENGFIRVAVNNSVCKIGQYAATVTV
eukprot:TRINITY_DN1960_c0_g1_i1.p1 TRINITY_DN1960_c0_g1~~TRINITY_DN1960_c0_g1_i1.p1  ORF type:complete len:347 (-),score=71.20 TRINITY_DN1960_c0_g1_i1:12-1019(-)